MDTVSRKFRLKKNGCVLSVLLHSDIIPLQILLLSYIIWVKKGRGHT